MSTITKLNEIELKNVSKKTYSFGYKELDKCLNGIKEGSIITIGARPGMGKSTFLNNIVLNLLERYNIPILYVSLEMNKNSLALQLSTIGNEISYYKIRDDEEKREEYIEKLKQKNYNLYISDDCYYIRDIEEVIENNQEIKFLVIDYIQLLRNETEVGSVLDKYNNTLDRLKVLAQKYNLTILLLSQLSRNVEYREYHRPRIVDLKQSGNLEDISDIIMFLYREAYYDRRCNNMATEIMIAKNKWGNVGDIIYLDYDDKKSEFINYGDTFLDEE